MTTTLNVVSILQEYDDTEHGTNSAQRDADIGPFRTPALLHITANGSAAYRAGGGVSSGIVLILSKDGQILTQGDSFESQSSNITYRVSGACAISLAANTRTRITAKVEKYGDSAHPNVDSAVSLRVIAVAAQK